MIASPFGIIDVDVISISATDGVRIVPSFVAVVSASFVTFRSFSVGKAIALAFSFFESFATLKR